MTPPKVDSAELIEGRWYWVTKDPAASDDEWWPARRDSSRVGGWTNDDTWEDFTHDVRAWKLMPTPSDLA
jgi:hypothetical protein